MRTIPRKAVDFIKERDFLLLVPLLLLNPLLYAFNRDLYGMLPDSSAYLFFGHQLAEHGTFFIKGWGHVDNGLVLPPLYPALIELLNLFNGDGIHNAELISTLALLLSSIALYFLIRRMSRPSVAIAGVIIFQLNIFNLDYGTAALTEALYIFIFIALLNLNARYLQQKNEASFLALLTGVMVALLFFTRQIGIFYLAVFPLLLLPELLRRSQRAWRGVVIFYCGFLLLFTPYSLLLYHQSGHGPFTQYFRLHQYVVEQQDTGTVDSHAPTNYQEIYQQRREQRRLLSDASEMLGNLLPKTPAAQHMVVSSVSRYLQNVSGNIHNSFVKLGRTTTILFLLAGLLGLFQAYKTGEAIRALIPLSIIIYLLTLSLVTGTVDRYAAVLFPVIAIPVLTEGYSLINGGFISSHSLRRYMLPLLTIVLIGVIPQLFTKAKLHPRFGENNTPISHCKSLVEPGAPVFSLTTLESYLLGGRYRILPNDNLSKIAEYGRRTGVEWLFVRISALNAEQAQYYGNAPWLKDPSSSIKQDPDYELRCASPYGDAWLYHIRQPEK